MCVFFFLSPRPGFPGKREQAHANNTMTSFQKKILCSSIRGPGPNGQRVREGSSSENNSCLVMLSAHRSQIAIQSLKLYLSRAAFEILPRGTLSSRHTEHFCIKTIVVVVVVIFTRATCIRGKLLNRGGGVLISRDILQKKGYIPLIIKQYP